MSDVKKEKVNVLFVCTGNTCRSPMAEQIFIEWLRSKKYSGIADVSSAGIYANDGMSMTPEAARALMDTGLTVRPHKSRSLTVDLLQNADIIVCMTEGHRRALLSSPSYAFASSDGIFRIIGTVEELTGEEVPDPFGCGMEAYNRTAEILTAMCEPLYDAIVKFADEHKIAL